jgi:hypothetical protein
MCVCECACLRMCMSLAPNDGYWLYDVLLSHSPGEKRLYVKSKFRFEL